MRICIALALIGILLPGPAVAVGELGVFYDEALTVTEAPSLPPFVAFDAWLAATSLDGAGADGLEAWELTLQLPPEVIVLEAVLPPSAVNFGSAPESWIVGLGYCHTFELYGPDLRLVRFRLLYSTTPTNGLDWGFAPADPTSLDPPAAGFVDCAGQLHPFGSSGAGLVGGVVTDEAGPVAGVTVDLIDAAGGHYTTLTDAQGNYQFAPVPSGVATVSVVVPLGHEAAVPASGEQSGTVPPSAEARMDFELVRAEAGERPRQIGYWRHQVRAHFEGKGQPSEARADVEQGYPQFIFDRLHSHPFEAIQVEGATFRATPGGAAPLDLATMASTLDPSRRSGSALAQRELLLLALNLVSQKLRGYDQATADGATVSQALLHAGQMVADEDPGNDEAATEICFALNRGQTLPAGSVPLGTPHIAYRSRASLRLLTANPSPGGVRFEIALDRGARLEGSVHDVRGRRVAQLSTRQHYAPGVHQLSWDGRDGRGRPVPAGTYFLRLRGQDLELSRRVTLVPVR